MVFLISKFHAQVSPEACGLTIDWQRISSGQEVVQWLWAKPVGEAIVENELHTLIDAANEIAASAEEFGLNHVDPASIGLNLPNEVAIINVCPFNPSECKSKHVAASGSGIVAS